jgi:allantoicase
MSDFTDLVDLAAERLGGATILANDEFFAPKENLLRAAAAEWREGVYTERGKCTAPWMGVASTELRRPTCWLVRQPGRKCCRGRRSRAMLET